MSDPKKQARRRKKLKDRQAAERRKLDRQEADSFFGVALRAHRIGNAPEALKLAKKALAISHDHCPALELIGKIYFEAQQYADAAYHFGLSRKYHSNPVAIYNCGLAHMKMGRKDEATADFHAFLEASNNMPEPQIQKLRVDTAYWLQQMAKTEKAAPAPAEQEPLFEPASKPKEPQAPPPPPPPPAIERPLVSVDLTVAPLPDLRDLKHGTLADYVLRRRFQELQLAQSFEDLVCLSSLTGVDSYAYQQETVRKVLRQFKGRALLADEVGLGKTIEACLALKEYWSRSMVRKALVLVPPSLVSQWKGELSEKFGFAPVSPDGPEFRRDPVSFWRQHPLIVASIAMARLEPHAGAIAAVTWDMVIVDEAHCLKNRAGANWKLVNALQKKFVLMLTATPVENNLIELYNLITVLKPGLLSTEAEFRKLFVSPGRPKAPKSPERLRALLAEVMVRNTRSAADVRLPHRIASSVVVPPAAAEAQLYEMVSRFVGERFQKDGKGFTLEWMQRQAGSSPHALCRSAGRALAEENRLSSADRRALDAIQEAAAQIKDSGKGLRLGQMLAARSTKTVVFTEFVPTLEYLVEVAQRHSVRYVVFRGDMSRAEKDTAIARFRDEADVLLSTGAGGEGRNLHFANTVINFDLPWNPMRLEQRVGRVHRIGQKQEVFVFNFCQGGTVEEQLLRVLHEKINMFELVIGEMDAILGTLDEGADFSQLILDLWISAGDAAARERAFDELAAKLLAAKSQYARTKELDEVLFRRDFEV